MSRRERVVSAHPRFECELAATNRSLAVLRARFADWLGALSQPRADRPHLVLALSELAATAVRGDGHIVARGWLEDGAVAIEVAATSSVRHGTSDAERGFAIVASITDALSVRAQGDRTLVCARKW